MIRWKAVNLAAIEGKMHPCWLYQNYPRHIWKSNNKCYHSEKEKRKKQRGVITGAGIVCEETPPIGVWLHWGSALNLFICLGHR